MPWTVFGGSPLGESPVRAPRRAFQIALMVMLPNPRTQPLEDRRGPRRRAVGSLAVGIVQPVGRSEHAPGPQPGGEAGARAGGGEDLVLDAVGEEADEGAVLGRHVERCLGAVRSGVVKAKLPAVLGLPAAVQVEQAGDQPVGHLLEPVEVPAVEGARRIDGEVRLDLVDRQVELPADLQTKVVEVPEVARLEGRRRRRVEPQDVVRADLGERLPAPADAGPPVAAAAPRLTRLGLELVEEILRKGALDDRAAPVRKPVENGLGDGPPVLGGGFRDQSLSVASRISARPLAQGWVLLLAWAAYKPPGSLVGDSLRLPSSAAARPSSAGEASNAACIPRLAAGACMHSSRPLKRALSSSRVSERSRPSDSNSSWESSIAFGLSCRVMPMAPAVAKRSRTSPKAFLDCVAEISGISTTSPERFRLVRVAMASSELPATEDNSKCSK